MTEGCDGDRHTVTEGCDGRGDSSTGYSVAVWKTSPLFCVKFASSFLIFLAATSFQQS